MTRKLTSISVAFLSHSAFGAGVFAALLFTQNFTIQARSSAGVQPIKQVVSIVEAPTAKPTGASVASSSAPTDSSAQARFQTVSHQAANAIGI